MKNAFNGLISRLDTTQEEIRKLEGKSIKWEKEKKGDKAKWSIQESWDNFKKCSICIIGIWEGEVRRKKITCSDKGW